MKEVMLSTSDNPYNPFTQFNEWYVFDRSHGYDCCGYLDRIARTSLELSEKDNNQAIDQAIDEILSYNLSGNYIKVEHEVED